MRLFGKGGEGDASTGYCLNNALADVKAIAARLRAWILVKPGADSKGQGCAISVSQFLHYWRLCILHENVLLPDPMHLAFPCLTS